MFLLVTDALTFLDLKRLDYDGTFLIEMWSEKSQDFRREIQQAKDYLSSKLKEAGYDVL